MHLMQYVRWLISLWKFAVYSFPRKRKPPTITASPASDFVVANASTDCPDDGVWVFNAEK